MNCCAFTLFRLIPGSDSNCEFAGMMSISIGVCSSFRKGAIRGKFSRIIAVAALFESRTLLSVDVFRKIRRFYKRDKTSSEVRVKELVARFVVVRVSG